jgi:hypothetical protein
MRPFFVPADAPLWLRAVLNSIRDAMSDVWNTALRLKDYATADLPPAADWKQGVVYDTTAATPKFSDGSFWYELLSFLTGMGVAATRTALAASSPSPAGLSRYLRESGREGHFVFSTSNLSTQVTADTAQGIYVAPASDTTGASGAWVRKFTGPLDVKWFGAVADDTTDCLAAFNAAIAAAKLFIAAGSPYQPTPTIYFPAGKYYFSDTLDVLDATVHLLGASAGSARDGGWATQIRVAAGVHGVRIQNYNTTGETTRANGIGAYGSTLENLLIYTSAAGGSTTADGIRLRAKATIKNCNVYNFPRHGLNITTTSGGGGAVEGNANGFLVIGGYFWCNGNSGIFVDGADANAGNIIGADCSGNAKWGIWDAAFLGNLPSGCHTEGNGIVGAGTFYAPSTATSFVTYLGNFYSVIPGQEVGASTNAPSGTTADNTWWYYISAGIGITAWVSGMDIVSGGPYYVDDNNARTTLQGCYSEGNQGLSILAPSALALGGLHGAGVRGASVQATNTTVTVNALTVTAASVFNGTTQFTGDQSFPGAANANAYVYHSNANGLILYGHGTSYDVGIFNRAGGTALTVTANTTNVVAHGNLSVTSAASAASMSVGNGAVGTPSIQFANSATSGFYSVAAGTVSFSAAGTAVVLFAANTGDATYPKAVRLRSSTVLGWSSGDPDAAADDVMITRTAAGQLSLGTTPGAADGALALGSLSATGDVDLSGVLEVDGTQVVGNQGAAVADATDAASAITQLNALLARCRAHGLIAT